MRRSLFGLLATTGAAAFVLGACSDDSATDAGSTSGAGAGATTGVTTGAGGLDFTTSASTGTGGAGGDGGGGPACGATPIVSPLVWAKAVGDAAEQTAASVAVDAAGNVLVAGAFAGSLTFGTTTLTSAGATDVFVAKLDAAGNAVWAKSFGGAKDQAATSVAVDAAGNVVVTGLFLGSVGFGGATFTSAGCCFQDVFVVKLDSQGNHLWSKQFGDVNGDTGRTVAVDAAGNVLVAGEFQTGINLGGAALVGAGGYDVFVAKLDPQGNHVWSKGFGAAADQGVSGIAAAGATNDVVITGESAGSIAFGGAPVTAAGASAAYVARLGGAAGAHVWSKGFGDGSAAGVGVAANADGDVVAIGDFQGTIDFGGGPHESPVNDDVFVVKLDAAGGHLWSRTYGDSLAQRARAVAIGADGSVGIAGRFGGSIDLGGGAFASAGIFDGFVAKLDADGCHLHSRALSSAAFDSSEGVGLDPTGHLVVAGSFGGPLDFGAGAVTPSGGADVFVARLGP